MKAVFFAGYTFEAVKNLYADPICLRFGLFCKFWGIYGFSIFSAPTIAFLAF